MSNLMTDLGTKVGSEFKAHRIRIEALENTSTKAGDTVTLTGDVTGTATVSSDGSISITATVADDSHNHIISNVDGLQAALDGKASTSVATISVNGLMSFTDKTKLDDIATGANNYTLPTATSTVKGGVELFSDTVQSVAANAVTTTASRTYGVQLNSAGQAVVNVPWSDTNTVTTVNNTLTSTSTTQALSAAQGKVLQDSKQTALVSGTNIKTVNGESLLGSGDVVVSGGGGTITVKSVSVSSQITPSDVNSIIECENLTGNITLFVDASQFSIGDTFTVSNVRNSGTLRPVTVSATTGSIYGTSNYIIHNWQSADFVLVKADQWAVYSRPTVLSGVAHSVNLETMANPPTASSLGATAIGRSSTAAGSNSLSFNGGYTSNQYGIVFGAGSNSLATVTDGDVCFNTSISSTFYATHLFRLGGTGTDTTPVVLKGGSNNVLIRNNSAVSVRGNLVGRDTAGLVSSFSYEFTIKRGANASATVLLGLPTVTLIQTEHSGVTASNVVITANTTSGGFSISCTGVTGSTIKWSSLAMGAEA
jgi:hypothetical protein